MAKRGRKSLFNEKIRETIIRLAKEGKTEPQIAEVIGVSLRTIQTWKGKHIELAHAVRESKLVADQLVEASLFQRALGYSHPEEKVFCHEGFIVTHEVEKHYPPDTQAAMFWLRNRQPKEWREKNESDVNINNSVQTLTDEQLDAKIQTLIAKSKPKKE